jgi:hypothetical protein
VEEVSQRVEASTEPGSRLATLEPAHRLISTLDAAMILLDPVVQILVGPMVHSFAEFSPDRPWVTVVPGACR